MGRGSSGGPAPLKKIGVPEATVNMLKAACGPGALGLAFASSRAGLALGPALLLGLQACCVYNMHLMVRLKQHMAREAPGRRSYGDLGEFVFGPKGSVAVETLVTIQQLGVCCVYFQFVSANIAAVLVNLGIDPSVTRLRRSQLMICAYFVFAPLAMIRSWKALAPLSFIANCCIFSGIGIALVYIVPPALTTAWLAATGDELELALLQERALPPNAATSGAPLLFGAVIYSFEMICNVLPIENSMREPEKMRTVINISMAIYCAVMYAVAMLPVVAFGITTEGSLTAELGLRFTDEKDRVTVIVMNMLVVVAVTLTFPVQFYPAIEVIETRLGMRGSVAGGPQTGGQGSDGGEYALVGSSDAAEEEEEEEEDGDHAAHDEDDDEDGEDGVGSDDERKGMITARTEAEAAGGVAGGDGGGSCWKRLCLRCLCVLFAGGVALAVPNLELVIALFGSLNAPLLAMILPPVMAIKVLDHAGAAAGGGGGGSNVGMLHRLIVVLGCTGCALGTTSAVAAIVEEMLDR